MEKSEKKALTVQTLTIFWRHARVYWPMLILCCAGIVIVIAADILSPLAWKRLIDLLGVDPVNRAEPGSLEQIWHAGLLLALNHTALDPIQCDTRW